VPRRPRGQRLRRTWGQRAVISLNALALVAAAVTAGALAYGNQQVSEIGRVALGSSLQREGVEEGDPQNYLIVGIDDASGLADGDSVRNRGDDLAGQHTDTIMVMRVDPKAATAQLLSFPRDLWIPIAGTDSRQRINTALETGGPSRLIDTISENFGIPIHHYVQVDFAGFRELVEVVDGIPVSFPRPARAASSGLVIEEAGCYTLGPVQALGFARARKDYQVQDLDGDWHLDQRGDYSRVERQQLFVELALRRAISKGARNPNTLRRLIELGVDNVRIDDSLEPGDLVSLGSQFRGFNADELQTYRLPTVEDKVGEADVLFLQDTAAEPILAVFRGVAPAPAGSVEPADVTVQVLNGTGTQGQGSEVTEELVAAGFQAIVPDDSPFPGLPTTVRYAPGHEAQAHLVARYLAGPVQYAAASDLEGADVVVVTGPDWEGVAALPRGAGDVPGPTTTTTTTTAPPSGTATTAPGTTEGAEGDPDDPDDPAYYRAEAPPPGADCPATS
jgi:LCP family protein required for cell wall assembly